MGFFTFLLIIAFHTGYFLGIMNNYLQSFLSAQFLYRTPLVFSSLSLIPITYNFVCVVMVFFFPQMHYFVFISIEIQLQSYHPVIQHCELLLWVFEISTELTVLNRFLLFIPFPKPFMNMLSWTNSGTDPWGTSLVTSPFSLSLPSFLLFLLFLVF